MNWIGHQIKVIDTLLLFESVLEQDWLLIENRASISFLFRDQWIEILEELGFGCLDEQLIFGNGDVSDRSQRLNSFLKLWVVCINEWALVSENSAALVHTLPIDAKLVVEKLGRCLVPDIGRFGVQTLFQVGLETRINTHKVVGEVWALILAAKCDLINRWDKLIARSDLRKSWSDWDNKNGHRKRSQSYEDQHTERVVERKSESKARVDSAQSSKNDILSWVFFVKILFQISDTVTLSPWLVEWGLTHVDSIGLLEPFVTWKDNGDQEKQSKEAQEPVDTHGNPCQHIFLLHGLCNEDGLIVEARHLYCLQRGTFRKETIEVKWRLACLGLETVFEFFSCLEL